MGSPAAHLGRVCITPYDALRIALGLILLTAAALKGQQLATEPVAETSLFTSRWFLICVVEFELFFGLWAFAGVHPKSIPIVGVLCLGSVSIIKSPLGEVSCR